MFFFNDFELNYSHIKQIHIWFASKKNVIIIQIF